MNPIFSKFRFLSSPCFLWAYAVVALLVPNVALCLTERMPLAACAVNVLLPLSVYALLMSLSAKTGRQVWVLFPLVFFAAFQMVLIYLYGSGVIAVDMFLNLLTTNPGEAMELLDNLVPAVAGVVFLYLPLLAVAAVQWARRASIGGRFLSRMRRLSLCGCAVSAVLAIACYAAWPKGGERVGRFEFRVEDDVYPANVFYNLALAVRESWLSAHYQERVAGFRFGARSSRPKDRPEVYVLVIGETARSRDFQLYGYGRPTNPLLSAEKDLMVFRRVTSQSNTTHKSVPMLLSAATAADHDRLYREKGLIAAFREAGFHTVFLSNQQPNHSYIDFLGGEADDCVFIRESSGTPATVETPSDVAAATSDERLLPYVRRVLAARRGGKLLVVLHTYGSHFNYRDRYSQRHARFLPDTPTEAKVENRPQLLNAYDNTILQTDRILASLIRMLRSEHCPAAMLYTSDHGENIFDDARRLFLHASPRPSEYDTDVPLLVWTSGEYAAAWPSVVRALRGNVDKGAQSSVSVFHTMLSIGGVEAEVFADSLSLASPHYRLGTRRYLNDHNHAVPLSMYGIAVRGE